MNAIITLHRSIGKNPIHTDYFLSTEVVEPGYKDPKLKFGERVWITMHKNFSNKCYSNSWSKEIFLIDSMLKITPRTYKIKDLNKETIIETFYKNEMFLSKL